MAPHPSGQGVVPQVGLALLISVLCGVLVAGLALPLVGGAGLIAKAGADDFMSLPTDLETPPLATRSTVLAADGSVLASFYEVDRITTGFEQIPVTARQAIVAIEDSRFYEHNGVDVKGTIRAAITNAQSGRVAQGGSTLTQQYVKNALIEAAAGNKDAERAAREDSAERKLQEARFALALEEKVSKDEILHRYLEIAYYGNGVYGIGTAANYYFNKPIEKLTLAESAELAGMVQNPTRFNPMSPDATVRQDVLQRRNTVLARMRELAMIDPAAAAAAEAEPLPQVTPDKAQRDCDAGDVTAPFFCDYVLRELTDTPVGAGLGATAEARQNRLFRGGLTVRTSLDPKVQASAQAAVDQRLPANDPSAALAVSDVVEPGTGLIKAMAVDRPFGAAAGRTKVNFANGGISGFQPGSTFKVFTLTAALEMGIALDTKIPSPPKYTSPIFKNGSGPYIVNNAEESEGGTFDLTTGTAKSVNTFFIQLAERTGLDAPYGLAERLGVQWKKTAGLSPFSRASAAGVIGAMEVSPLAMAGAYATFAARGVYCPPRAVVAIDSPTGPVAVPPNPCGQAVPQGVADTVTQVLTGVITGGTATRNGQLGRPAAGKTGTTNDSTAAWFIGFTPQLATAVWVGHSTPAPLKGTVAGVTYKQMFGGDLPTQIWKQTMTGALAGVPAKDFPPADPVVVKGKTTPIPSVTGKTYAQAAAILVQAGFVPVKGTAVASAAAAGVIVKTSPAAGADGAVKETVFVYPSTGVPPPAPPVVPVDPTLPQPVQPQPVVPPAAGAPAAGAPVPP